MIDVFHDLKAVTVQMRIEQRLVSIQMLMKLPSVVVQTMFYSVGKTAQLVTSRDAVESRRQVLEPTVAGFKWIPPHLVDAGLSGRVGLLLS